MNPSPFVAKVSQVVVKAGSDLLQLTLMETDVAHQPHLPQIAKQFKSGMHFDPDHMNVRRAVIVGEDHHSEAVEMRQNCRHGSI